MFLPKRQTAATLASSGAGNLRMSSFAWAPTIFEMAGSRNQTDERLEHELRRRRCPFEVENSKREFVTFNDMRKNSSD